MTGGFGTDLPHWTDPPTGEVPRILPDSPDPEPDDLAAWQALGARGTRWRDDASDWDDLEGLDQLGGDEDRLGALDQSRTAHSDLYSFDAEFERLEEERSGRHRAVSGSHRAVAVDDARGGGEPPHADLDEPGVDDVEPAAVPPGAGVGRTQSPRQPRRPPSRPTPGLRPGPPNRSDELGPRVAVGIGLVVLLIVFYAIGAKALLVFAAALVVLCAVEAYGMLQRSGFRPATLLGLVATGGVMFGAYWRGPDALPLVAAMVFLVGMLWYLLGIVEARPLANVAVTTSTFIWIGLLGSYAALLLRAHDGRGLFLGAVLPAVGADIAAYFVGSQIGSRPIAPKVSPGKTVEGVLGGGVVAIIVALIIGHFVAPWGGLKHGLLLGLVVAVVAPIGDLLESMIKRDLSVKDSGTILPGHGGVLDRLDSVLLVLPAVYYLASLFNLVH
ncbi:MAG: phosphatidate cytidylyltransferase [Acidimicrobiales bacterium]